MWLVSSLEVEAKWRRLVSAGFSFWVCVRGVLDDRVIGLFLLCFVRELLLVVFRSMGWSKNACIAHQSHILSARVYDSVEDWYLNYVYIDIRANDASKQSTRATAPRQHSYTTPKTVILHHISLGLGLALAH